jgi:hypothetical protein
LRVSLQIDGDASGAVKAAEDASRGVEALGKMGDDASGKLAEGFIRATEAAGKVKGMSEAAGAANDNFASTIASGAQKIADFTQKTLGSESALAKATAGTSSFATGIGAVIQAAGPLSLISGTIGLTTTAISTFYTIANGGAPELQRNLDEHARLINLVRDAYKDATNKAAAMLFDSTSNAGANPFNSASWAATASTRRWRASSKAYSATTSI